MKENYKLVKEAHQDLPFIEVAKKVQAQYNELGDAERAVRNNCCILAPLCVVVLPHTFDLVSLWSSLLCLHRSWKRNARRIVSVTPKKWWPTTRCVNHTTCAGVRCSVN